MHDKMIEVKNVSKVYDKNRLLLSSKKPKQALSNVSFDVYENEIFGIVGESGSGKTTLAKLIMGTVELDDGDIRIMGHSVKENRRSFKQQAQEMQLIFQDPYGSLNPKRSVGWSIEEALHIHGIGTKKERREKVYDLLEMVGLSKKYYERKPHELSGGQRQRIAIASALILDPKILLIDEGVSALDVSVQASILNLLSKLQKENHLTVIFISHDLNVIQYFCDRVAVLKDGILQEVFDVDTFKTDKHADYTIELFHATPRID